MRPTVMNNKLLARSAGISPANAIMSAAACAGGAAVQEASKQNALHNGSELLA